MLEVFELTEDQVRYMADLGGAGTGMETIGYLLFWG